MRPIEGWHCGGFLSRLHQPTRREFFNCTEVDVASPVVEPIYTRGLFRPASVVPRYLRFHGLNIRRVRFLTPGFATGGYKLEFSFLSGSLIAVGGALRIFDNCPLAAKVWQPCSILVPIGSSRGSTVKYQKSG